MKYTYSEIQTSSSIQTPPESPIQSKEWAQAVAEIGFLICIVLPIWTALGFLLTGPSALLRKFSHCFSKPTQKYIHHIYAFSIEIFCILRAGIKYPLAYCMHHKTVEKEGQPILLIHGYLHNASNWTRIIKRFKKKGLGPVYTLNFRHPFLSIHDYAQEIRVKAEEIRKITGRKELILIGHSMGGVVSSLYATKLALEGSVTDVFTLGSPLKGSPLANRLAVGPNGREMRPSAPLLKEICEGIIKKSSSIRFYHIGSDSDALVPIESALPGNGKQLRVSDLGHINLMTSRKIIDWICAELIENFRTTRRCFINEN